MVSELNLIVRWWLALTLPALGCLPLTLALFDVGSEGNRRPLPCMAFARALGLALCPWPVFALASFFGLPFNDLAARLSALVPLVLTALLALRSPRFRRRVTARLRAPGFLASAAAQEALFLAALLLWAYFRGCTPELNSLEKFMDHGFVAAMLKSTALPAPDMWWAGGTINYYYYGHYITAWVCRVSGIGSGVGYNLAMATTFALCVSLSAALAAMLARVWHLSRLRAAAAGLLAAFLVSVGGNGHAFLYSFLLPKLSKLGLCEEPASYWYPNATRFINCYDGSNDRTIHEFPFYSFIVSDLHAHVLDIAFVMLFLALMLAVLARARRFRSRDIWQTMGDPALWMAGFLLGIMTMTNYWDFAVYTVVSLFFAVVCTAVRAPQGKALFVVEAALRVALLQALRVLVSLPFQVFFSPMHAGIGIVSVRSPLWQWLVLWYPGLLAALAFGIWFAVRYFRVRKEGFYALFAAPATAEWFVAVLFVCALGLIVGPELVYVKDIYGTAPRANTMFKLTYQAFMLFGIATGTCLARFWPSVRALRHPTAIVRALCFALAVFVPACYVLPTLHSTYLGKQYKGLDGLAFIEDESADEWALIEYLNENVPAGSVVAEASGYSYTQNCRISMATGLATIVGWHTHEWLWRDDPDAVNARFTDVEQLYTSADLSVVQAILKNYGVDYVVVGPRERERYGEINLQNLRDASTGEMDFGSYLLLMYDTESEG